MTCESPQRSHRKFPLHGIMCCFVQDNQAIIAITCTTSGCAASSASRSWPASASLVGNVSRDHGCRVRQASVQPATYPHAAPKLQRYASAPSRDEVRTFKTLTASSNFVLLLPILLMSRLA